MNTTNCPVNVYYVLWFIVQIQLFVSFYIHYDVRKNIKEEFKFYKESNVKHDVDIATLNCIQALCNQRSSKDVSIHNQILNRMKRERIYTIPDDWQKLFALTSPSIIDPGPPGPMGLLGPIGQQGFPGEKGEPGHQGPPGLNGKPGTHVKGEPGEKGEQGLRPVGTFGPKGALGPRGLTGNKGDKGDNGIPGPSGITGKRGPEGEKGQKGDIGVIGVPGIPGPRGVQGFKGSIGQSGLQGEKGTKGEFGFQGPQGIKGTRGLVGEKGERGVNGTTGSPGLIGPPGIQGPRGIPGSEGFRGEKGTKGDGGFQGAPGVNGKPGNIGERGDKGDPGVAGVPGSPGQVGPKGFHGLQSPPGPQGIKGDAGYQGIPGVDGKLGPKGSRGEQGVRGIPSRCKCTSEDNRAEIKKYGKKTYEELSERNSNCLLHSLKTVVIDKTTDRSRGLWMVDQSPKTKKDSEKVWILDVEDSSLNEYVDDILIKDYDLYMLKEGNSYAIYNGSFLAVFAQKRPIIIKYHLHNQTSQILSVPELSHPQFQPIYSLGKNFFDFSVDDNGLWLLFAVPSSNNTGVLKLNPNSMTIQYMWNITLKHREFSKMFVAHGILYGISTIGEKLINIPIAIDLYENQVYDIDLNIVHPDQITAMEFNYKTDELMVWSNEFRWNVPILCTDLENILNQFPVE